jgi:hypothetical protein
LNFNSSKNCPEAGYFLVQWPAWADGDGGGGSGPPVKWSGDQSQKMQAEIRRKEQPQIAGLTQVEHMLDWAPARLQARNDMKKETPEQGSA